MSPERTNPTPGPAARPAPRRCVQYGCREVESFALRRFGDLRQGKAVHPDIPALRHAAGACTEGQALAWFDRRFSNPKRTRAPEHPLALRYFRGEGEIEKSSTTFSLRSRAQQVHSGGSPGRPTPFAASILWDWYVSSLSRIEQFHPMIYERVIAAVVPAAGIDRPDLCGAFFANTCKNREGAGRDPAVPGAPGNPLPDAAALQP